MRFSRRLMVTAGLSIGLVTAAPLAAEYQCVPGMSACASLTNVTYYGDKIIFRVTNMGTEGFARAVLLKFNGDLPDPLKYVNVYYGEAPNLYGPADEKWQLVTTGQSQGQGQGNQFDTRITDNVNKNKGGVAGLSLDTENNIATFVIDLGAAPEEGFGLDTWSAFMQGQGPGATGYTVTTSTPEPVTMVLLASGLLAVGGVGLARRKVARQA